MLFIRYIDMIVIDVKARCATRFEDLRIQRILYRLYQHILYLFSAGSRHLVNRLFYISSPAPMKISC
jgi:hypothetical protein